MDFANPTIVKKKTPHPRILKEGIDGESLQVAAASGNRRMGGGNFLVARSEAAIGSLKF